MLRRTRELGFSAPAALAVDATGVYVTGRDFPSNFSYLRKYGPDGAVLWTTRFGGSVAFICGQPFQLSMASSSRAGRLRCCSCVRSPARRKSTP